MPAWKTTSGAAGQAPTRGRLVVRLLACAVVSAGILAGLLLHLREQAITSGEAVLGAFAQLTEDQTSRIVANVDEALQAVDEKLATATREGSATEEAIRVELDALLIRRPFLKVITVVDGKGRTIFGSKVRERGLDLYGAIPFEQQPYLLKVFQGSKDPGIYYPETFAKGPLAAVLLAQGIAHLTVDPGNTERMAKAWHRSRGQAVVKFYPGATHMDTQESLVETTDPQIPVRQDVLSFIETH